MDISKKCLEINQKVNAGKGKFTTPPVILNSDGQKTSSTNKNNKDEIRIYSSDLLISSIFIFGGMINILKGLL